MITTLKRAQVDRVNRVQSTATCCLLSSSHDACDDRMFYKEAVSLRQAGYDVVIISPAHNVPQETHGVRFLGSIPGRSPLGYRLGLLWKSLATAWLGLKVNAEVYHCHTADLLFPAILIRLGQRLFRGKRVFIIHEIRDFYLQEAYLDSKLGRKQRVYLALRERWDRFHQRRCDHIVGPEETKVERPLSYGIPPHRVSVIENYVRPELFSVRVKIFDPHNFVVGYAGGLSCHRGIDKLAEACAILGARHRVKVTLLLAGRWSPETDAQRVADFCARNTQFLNLRVLGWLPHLAVSEALAQVDVCCALFFSRRYEKVLSGKAGPIKLYEYMASGKPVIATDLSALRYVIEKAQCGTLVNAAGGAEAVARALEHYYTNPQRMIEHGTNGRRAVEQWFSWRNPEKRLLRIYAEMLSQGTQVESAERVAN